MLKHREIAAFIEKIGAMNRVEDGISFFENFLQGNIGTTNISVIANPFQPKDRIVYNNLYSDITACWENAVNERPTLSQSHALRKSHFGQFFWGSLHGDHLIENRDYRRFIDLCADAGYGNNITMVAGGDYRTEVLLNYLGLPPAGNRAIAAGDSMAKIRFISGIFQEKYFKRPDLARQEAARSFLSQKEIEVLQWVSNGYRPSQAADQMGISDWTVREYLASATRKLNARTVPQAIAKAVSWAIVRID